MIYELKENYEKVRPLFKEWKNPAIHAVIDRNNLGKIYVDTCEDPRTALIWSRPDMFFLAGDEDNKEFSEAFNNVINEKIAPEALRIGLTYFAVQVFPLEKWESKINGLLKNRTLKINYEWAGVFNKEKYEFHSWNIPPGGSLHRIDTELVERISSTVIRDEIKKYWASVRKFTEKGVGFCMLHNNEVITSCISCHVTGNIHEISINTFDPQNRNKGFATLTARAFIEHCISEGLTPYWKADIVNPASIAVAEKVGFEKIEEYPDFYFFF